MTQDGFEAELKQMLDQAQAGQVKRDMRRVAAKALTAFLAILIWEAGQAWPALGQERNHIVDHCEVRSGDKVTIPVDNGSELSSLFIR